MSALDTLMAAVKKTQTQKFEDPNEGKYWKVEADNAGNGYAIIRFLPGKTDEDVPFVKTYSHGFKNAGGRWFVDNCPTTIGEKCPVCDSNSPLWNSGIESNKEIVRQRKRKVGYVANILVVSDPKHPENDGKVFMFKFGQKIFDKITGALSPEFEDEKPMNPFDMDSGCNFKLKMRRVEGFANFDKSEFDKASEVENQKEILKQLHDIQSLVAPDQYKSYDELKTKLDRIIGGSAAPASNNDDDDDRSFMEKAAKAAKSSSKSKNAEDDDSTPPKSKAKAVVSEESEDDDDSMAYFKKLAESD